MFRIGSTILRNSSVPESRGGGRNKDIQNSFLPTVVLARSGVKRKWFLGLMQMTSNFFLLTERRRE